MFKTIALAFAVMTTAALANAQVPSGNIFAGYSYSGGDVFAGPQPGAPSGAFLQPPSRSYLSANCEWEYIHFFIWATCFGVCWQIHAVRSGTLRGWACEMAGAGPLRLLLPSAVGLTTS